ncbi:leucyl aminopeptidase [Desertihabitans brevis]|uniref:Probable cytosol aminopeptidase n=1 Tax=Desertihabitans brevis TaxID=2268447 RepID=A0A367YUT3_9ACTN|nr:leucyl aminopeptidase [Desertihabitans brevis]RCK69517.1 leucyl aminopeptidase [Desertihabitans brevis]
MTAPAIPQLQLSPTPPRSSDILVVGLVEAPDGPQLVGADKNLVAATAKRFGRPLLDLATELGARTGVGQVTLVPAAQSAARLAVVGLGPVERVTPEVLRRAAGSALRTVAGLGLEGGAAVTVDLGTAEAETAQAAAEGALLGSYRHQPISSEDPDPAAVRSVTVVADLGRRAGELAEVVGVVCQAVLRARHWVNLPPNLLYPETFAEEARALARGTRLAVEVLDEAALTKGGYGGLLAVGGGSARGPRLVRLSYRPRGATTHLVLVGKGITFDSGGLNLKPGDSMYTMKCDMAGAAAVLAATRAVADLGLKVSITCYAAMAENLPSSSAYRPSDVLTIYGGTTVENANTDAEGRLVMADALARSQEDEPDLVLDVATLTGACMVALGDRIAGVMSNDDEAVARVLDAAEVTGEEFWELPLTDQFREGLDSSVADVKSSGGRLGGAMSAAAFLERFVAEGTPWAHLDIAGPAFNSGKPWGHVPEGGTGAAVRTLVQLARSLA